MIAIGPRRSPAGKSLVARHCLLRRVRPPDGRAVQTENSLYLQLFGQQHQVPVCQYLPADPIDDHVVQVFFAALAPVELDIYERVLGSLSEEHEQIHRARQQELERLRYQARLAERQFQKSDPDNRLVTAELEKRWEIALRE